MYNISGENMEKNHLNFFLNTSSLSYKWDIFANIAIRYCKYMSPITVFLSSHIKVFASHSHCLNFFSWSYEAWLTSEALDQLVTSYVYLCRQRLHPLKRRSFFFVTIQCSCVHLIHCSIFGHLSHNDQLFFRRLKMFTSFARSLVSMRISWTVLPILCISHFAK